MSELDVKQIMQEIRQEALRRMPELEKLPDILDLYGDLTDNSNKSFNSTEYANYLMLLNRFWQVPLDRPLVRHSGIKGFVKYIYQKVCRKLIRWYIAPAFEELNENSSRNVNLHNQISLFMEEQKIEIERLKSIVDHLQETIK